MLYVRTFSWQVIKKQVDETRILTVSFEDNISQCFGLYNDLVSTYSLPSNAISCFSLKLLDHCLYTELSTYFIFRTLHDHDNEHTTGTFFFEVRVCSAPDLYYFNGHMRLNTVC